MYQLEIIENFSAAHALRDYPGVCARIHGHNWTLKIGLSAETADERGMTIDYADLKTIADKLIEEFDHNFFNDHPYFKTVNPTSEKIAEYIYGRLESQLPGRVRLEYVQIAETENFSVKYRK
ncbi:6-carboxytetrahydropterin synthase QueD [bacterium]|nr:6-carboxytetrahydropterin synthase QueD [bacterium]